jgi:hypothetical protein
MEVMLATVILVFALAVLVELQGTAALATMEADKIIVGTQLAQEKLTEVRMMVENEGFPDDDVTEKGEFDDFGTDALNVEFQDLEDYHWEYLVSKVDLEAAGDLTSTANNMMQSFGDAGAGEATQQLPDLSQFGVSSDMIAQMLDPFLREGRVRVWWGTDDPDEAEERGDLVVLTTHIIQPNANVLGMLGGSKSSGGSGGEGGGRGKNGLRGPTDGREGNGDGGGRGGGRGGRGGRGGLSDLDGAK